MNEKRHESLLGRLNDRQLEAATHLDGPAVVFAGAGSGKTRIITTRIAWLITQQGVSPWQILALTFTNKAATEMRERVLALCPIADKCLISTFHSACAKWLREFAPELGFSSDFSIYDDSDQNSVIKKIMQRGHIRLDKDTSVAEFRQGINHAKTLGLFPKDRDTHKSMFSDFMPLGGVDVYAAYQETLALANAMDFNDLIMNMILLLRTNARVKQLMQDRYRYILVDEYQDTNRPQMELLAHLSQAHKNLFVVGDDDQSIYSWRGAVPANIIDFNKSKADVKIVKLEQNYRCSGHIVNAAAAVVSHNKVRAQKTLRTENPSGELIDFRYETDGEFEAWWVADTIKNEVRTYDYQNVAIFYRTNSQSRLLEDALRKEKIPYQIYGSVRFYDRAEVKDILSYLKILVNPKDDVSFFRALNTPPRGLGDSAVEAITQLSRERSVSAFEAAKELSAKNLPRLSNKLQSFFATIAKITKASTSRSLPEFIEFIIDEIGYFSYLTKKFPDQADDKQDNVMELVSAVSEFVDQNQGSSLGDWLQTMVLSSEAAGDGYGVNLMTLHMAKGLEFDRVYLVGLEDGLLPHFNSCNDKAALEEERRLLYVGMTRAKKKLSLTAAYLRRTYGQTQSNEVSRFLGEIPEKLVNILTPHQEKTAHPIEETLEQPLDSKRSQDGHYYEYGGDLDRPLQNVEIGKKVFHPTYGSGKVEQLEATFGRAKVVVKFPEIGLRRVELRHLSVDADD